MTRSSAKGILAVPPGPAVLEAESRAGSTTARS